MKTLILFQYHEICENLLFFINNGLFESENHTFVFICNGYNLSIKDDIWECLDKYSNVKLMLRVNEGLDFEAWNSVLYLNYDLFLKSDKIFFQMDCEHEDDLNNKLYSEANSESNNHLHTHFDTFIFLNSTVFGPCLPNYAKDHWTDYFTKNLSDSVYLVGISISYLPHPWAFTKTLDEFYSISPKNTNHVQSMSFCMHRKALDVLMRYRLFSNKKKFPPNKRKLILTSEIGMSSIFLHEGYSIYSLLIGQGELKPTDDIVFNQLWWTKNTNIPLIETIFVKTNTGKEYQEKQRYIKNFSGKRHEIVF